MTPRTMRSRTRQRIAAVMFMLCALLIASAALCSGEAAAQPDPHWPDPGSGWCRGNPPGSVMTGWGGFCEGTSWPDGSRWNTWYFGRGVQQPMRCIIPDGSPNPPLAGPGGCGGAA
jgi:hypothetical protein